MTPWGGANFDPRAFFKQQCRHSLGDVSCQISKLV
jgi:hypothetical protein